MAIAPESCTVSEKQELRRKRWIEQYLGDGLRKAMTFEFNIYWGRNVNVRKWTLINGACMNVERPRRHIGRDVWNAIFINMNKNIRNLPSKQATPRGKKEKTHHVQCQQEQGEYHRLHRSKSEQDHPEHQQAVLHKLKRTGSWKANTTKASA